MNDDFKSFSKIVSSGADFSQKSERGLSVQHSLGYFSTKNFKKACALLDSKGVNLDEPNEDNLSLLHLLAYACDYDKLSVLLKYKVDVNRKCAVNGFTPIEMTQFATFKFVTNQDIPKNAREKAEKCRNLLLKNGSEPFKYCEPTVNKVGNFAFCLFMAANTLEPFISFDMMNSSDLFEFYEENGQQTASVKFDLIEAVFKNVGIDAEISSFSDEKVFPDKIKLANDAEEPYFLIAQTANNPIAPYQWVCFNYDSEKLTKETPLSASNPDKTFRQVSFRVGDISQLILIKVNDFFQIEKNVQ